MDELLKYRVYEVNDTGVRAGISQEPLKDLKCAFETKEMAEDFIEYQKTVNPEKQYMLGESQEQEVAKISEADLDKWYERMYEEGLYLGTDIIEDAFEQYQNGADFKELVNELKELEKYRDVLLDEKGMQVPAYTLKASFEEYKQGTGIDEIAEQIMEGKYDEPLTAEELADREYLEENYFDASVAEGKTFTMYDKETGEKQFERPLEEFSNEDAFYLEENARKSSGWRRFEITDKEGNVLVTGDDSAFESGFKDLKDVLEYQEKVGVTEYKPVSKEQVEHTDFQEQAQTGQKKSESGIKNEETFIKQEIKSQGYRPKPGLVKNINQLNKMMDKSHSLKDISKMYKEKSLQESNPEAQKLVDKIGNELKAQELAKVAPISR